MQMFWTSHWIDGTVELEWLNQEEGLEVQGHLQLQSEFVANLGYMRRITKQNKAEEVCVCVCARSRVCIVPEVQ